MRGVSWGLAGDGVRGREPTRSTGPGLAPCLATRVLGSADERRDTGPGPAVKTCNSCSARRATLRTSVCSAGDLANGRRASKGMQASRSITAVAPADDAQQPSPRPRRLPDNPLPCPEPVRSIAYIRRRVIQREGRRNTVAHGRPTSCRPPTTMLISPDRSARTTVRTVRARPRAFQPAFLRHQLSTHHLARSAAVDPGLGNGSGRGRRKAWKRKRLSFCSGERRITVSRSLRRMVEEALSTYVVGRVARGEQRLSPRRNVNRAALVREEVKAPLAAVRAVCVSEQKSSVRRLEVRRRRRRTHGLKRPHRQRESSRPRPSGRSRW
jgi:hypothetical protein